MIGLALAVALACSSPEGRRPAPERAAAVAELAAGYATAHPDLPRVSAAEVLAQPDAFLLIDVRPEAERAVSVIPGSVTADAFEADPSLAAGRRAVAYCTAGRRSGDRAASWRAAGRTVDNLDGSLLAWTHAGGPLVDAQGEPTRRVHVYAARWDLVADGYEAVW